jgi:hypothetical protein
MIQQGTYYHKFTHVFMENMRYPFQVLMNLIFVDTFENTQPSHIHAVGTEVSVCTDRQTNKYKYLLLLHRAF